MKMYDWNFCNKLSKGHTFYFGKDLSFYYNFENNLSYTLN